MSISLAAHLTHRCRIGSQVLAFPNALQVAKQSNIQLALHTWSHTPLCGLTDEQIVAELGWNMQVRC